MNILKFVGKGKATQGAAAARLSTAKRSFSQVVSNKSPEVKVRAPVKLPATGIRKNRQLHCH